MLKQMRASTKKWPMKVFLGAVIISFGAWGIGDAIRPNVSPDTAIKVGDIEIATAEVQRRFNLQLSRITSQFAGAFSRDDAVNIGMFDSVVDELEDLAIINQTALDMGMVSTQETLRAGLMRDPAFRDPNGNFDKTRYLQTLGAIRLSEAEFLHLLSLEMRQAAVSASIGGTLTVPPVMVDTLIAYATETRAADGLLVRLDALPAPTVPTDAEVQTRYSETLDNFMNPELREITLVELKLEDFADPASVSIDDAREMYALNTATYSTGEIREIAQLIFDTEDEATAARETGSTLAEIGVAAEVGAPIDMGPVTPGAFEDAITDAVFALAEGDVSAPVETDFGWHLFGVTRITPSETRPFDEVRDDIINSLALQSAYDALYDATAKFEDLVARGTPLEEAAEQVGAIVSQPGQISAQGTRADGSPIEGLPSDPEFSAIVFDLEEGFESPMATVGEDYYTVRVDTIIEPAPIGLETRRATIIANLEREAREAAARQKIAGIRSMIDAGQNLSEIAAKDPALEAGLIGPITRSGTNPDRGMLIDTDYLGPDVVEALFSANRGELIEASSNAGVVVGRISEITIPDASVIGGQREQVENTLSRTTGQELVDRMLDVLYEEHRVIRNTPALNALKEG